MVISASDGEPRGGQATILRTVREGSDALIVDDDGRVLLVRRADDGVWAMPGGWVDPNRLRAALARA
jgi:ADP-ribose pyrophosphatase YjhB (NUDIX family)